MRARKKILEESLATSTFLYAHETMSIIISSNVDRFMDPIVPTRIFFIDFTPFQ